MRRIQVVISLTAITLLSLEVHPAYAKNFLGHSAALVAAGQNREDKTATLLIMIDLEKDGEATIDLPSAAVQIPLALGQTNPGVTASSSSHPSQAIQPSVQTNTASFLHEYQTIIVGTFTFLMGIFTLTLTLVFAARKEVREIKLKEREEKLKQLAFLSIMDRDVNYIYEQLQTAKDILRSIDPEETRASIPSLGSWKASVRLASRISPLRSFDQEWEKLYVVGVNNIILLRDFDIKLRDIAATFDDLLSQPETIRSPVTPLLPGLMGDDELEQVQALLTSLDEQIESALKLAEDLLRAVKFEFGERNGGVGISEEREKCTRNLGQDESVSTQRPSLPFTKN